MTSRRFQNPGVSEPAFPYLVPSNYSVAEEEPVHPPAFPYYNPSNYSVTREEPADAYLAANRGWPPTEEWLDDEFDPREVLIEGEPFQAAPRPKARIENGFSRFSYEAGVPS